MGLKRFQITHCPYTRSGPAYRRMLKAAAVRFARRIAKLRPEDAPRRTTSGYE